MNIPKSLISFIRIPILICTKTLHHLMLAENRGIIKCQQYRSFLNDKVPYKLASLHISMHWLIAKLFLIKNQIYIIENICFMQCIVMTVSPPTSSSGFSHLPQLSKFNSFLSLSLSHQNKNQRNWQITTTKKTAERIQYTKMLQANESLII